MCVCVCMCIYRHHFLQCIAKVPKLRVDGNVISLNYQRVNNIYYTSSLWRRMNSVN